MTTIIQTAAGKTQELSDAVATELKIAAMTMDYPQADRDDRARGRRMTSHHDGAGTDGARCSSARSHHLGDPTAWV